METGKAAEQQTLVTVDTKSIDNRDISLEVVERDLEADEASTRRSQAGAQIQPVQLVGDAVFVRLEEANKQMEGEQVKEKEVARATQVADKASSCTVRAQEASSSAAGEASQTLSKAMDEVATATMARSLAEGALDEARSAVQLKEMVLRTAEQAACEAQELLHGWQQLLSELGLRVSTQLPVPVLEPRTELSVGTRKFADPAESAAVFLSEALCAGRPQEPTPPEDIPADDGQTTETTRVSRILADALYEVAPGSAGSSRGG